MRAVVDRGTMKLRNDPISMRLPFYSALFRPSPEGRWLIAVRLVRLALSARSQSRTSSVRHFEPR